MRKIWLLLTVVLVAGMGWMLFLKAPTAAHGQDPAAGKAAWDKNCALCHGANAEGKVGPPLAGLAGHIERIAQLPGGMEAGLQTIRNGIPNRMPGFPPSILSDEELGDMVAYLLTTPPASGEQLFENPSSCAACHGKRGVGGVGPKLDARAAAAQLGLTKEQLLPGLIPLVRNGIPGRMPAFPVLTDGEIMSIGEYLWNLGRLSWEEQFALEHGRAPTGEDILDRDWGNRFLAH